MGNPAEERRIFQGFLAHMPLFAGTAVAKWNVAPKDPPDIECKLVDGRTIGLELTNWLDGPQIGRAKAKENLERPIERALLSVPNETKHLKLVWMSAKERLRAQDEAPFKAEMARLVTALDTRWESEGDWQSPQGFDWNDFSDYPTLDRYLTDVTVFPAITPRTESDGPGYGWLTFIMRGGSYSPDWAVEALCENIRAKLGKYSAKPSGLAQFLLLAHYDFKAYAYNTPVDGIDWSYPEAVAEASRRLSGSKGVFDGIFVFVETTDGQKTFTI